MAGHRLWLIRHGETQWSATGRHTGRTDVRLTDEGRRQAAALGRWLAGRSFALVLSSPLSRARETCVIARLGSLMELEEDLREWDYGAYEGRSTEDIRKEVPGWTIWTGDPAGGETAEQVGRRAARVIERAAAAHGDVALFGHGHMLRILAASWLGLSARAGRLFTLDTASLSVLGHEHGARVLETWNRRDILADG
jgi:broad specificity phosphatase PhoE